MRPRRWTWTLLAGCFAVFSLVGASGAAVLVQDGQPRAAVVVASGLPAITDEAVADLVRVVERMSGARLPVVASVRETDAPVRIWVGRHEGLEERFPGLDLSVPNYEEILIACQGDDVLLLGRDEAFGAGDRPGNVRQAGTALAVYDFMEKELGVRWLWPGELGEVIPKRATIRLEDSARRHVPIRQRGLRSENGHSRWVGAFQGDVGPAEAAAVARRMDDEVGDWLRRMRFNQQVYYRMMMAGHAFTQWHAKYAKDHPEYFALQPDGTRGVPLSVPSGYPAGSFDKICISNPDVAEVWLDEAERMLRNNPARLVVSASPNDSAYRGLCVCENCRAWDVEGGPTFTYMWPGGITAEGPAVTDRYVAFWNILARGLRERFPDRETFVGTWAYGPYRTPPVERTLEENIMVGFVSPHFPSDDNARRRIEERDFWAGWADKTDHLFWRPNLFHGHWGTPVLYSSRLGEEFRFMAERGLTGMDVDSMMNDWATQGLQYYLMARLAWNPYADAGALVEDYVLAAFGEAAAPAMRQYFAAMEERVAAMQETMDGKSMRDYIGLMPKVYHAEYVAQSRALLQEAKAATPEGGPQRQRVAFVKAGLDFTEAQMAAIAAMQDLRLGRGDIVQLARAAIEATDRRDAVLAANMDSFAVNSFRLSARTGYDSRNMEHYLGPVGYDFRLLAEAESDAMRIMLPTEWDFLLDPENLGIEQGWHTHEGADQLEWDRLNVTAPWGEQLRSDDPADPARVVYHGVAWYRIRFDIETLPDEGEELWLQFGAVDESCWVYLNGVEVAAQVFDGQVDPDAWRKPRRFEVSRLVNRGENTLIVRVQALAGQGGITRPVHLLRTQPNRLPDGGFERGMEGWRMNFHDENYPDVAQRAEVRLVPGRHVGEQAASLRLEAAPGEEAGRVYLHLRADARTPLRQGGVYEVRVRYRQTPQPRTLPADARPMRLRLYAYGDFEPDRQDRFWMNTPPAAIADWEEQTGLFTAPRDYNRFSITLFFSWPGQFDIDEVSVRPLAARP